MGGRLPSAPWGSAPVVRPQPALEGPGAVCTGRVGPAAQQDLDEAFGLAIGLRAGGAGAQVADGELRAALAPGARDVGRAVVGHHLLYDDALRAVPAQRPFEEGDGVAPAVDREHLRVGETA